MNSVKDWLIVLLAGATAVCLIVAAAPSAEPPALTFLNTSQPDSTAARTGAPAKDSFMAAHKDAEKAKAGEAGLAIWERFLADYPTGQFTELAQHELALWKDRAARNLVRWGPTWQPTSQVDAHVAKANALLAQVDSASPQDAQHLLARALAENPYGPEIYFKKALLGRQAGNSREFTLALGDLVSKADPDNAPALNDLGVVLAMDKKWTAALADLVRAAINTNTDAVFDNLDQVIVMAAAGGVSKEAIAACQLDVSKKLREAGRYAGQYRWGNTWITQEQYQKYTNENQQIDQQIAAVRRQIDAKNGQRAADQRVIDDFSKIPPPTSAVVAPGVVAYNRSWTDPGYYAAMQAKSNAASADQARLDAEAQKLADSIKDLESKKNFPSHAGKLILLGPDGSALETVELKG